MSADATGTRAEMCKCGHARKSHIYEEGACRPGFVCQESCRQFEPVDASSNRATVCERCGSGLLDGKHIASYPPCNGEDAIRNSAATPSHRVAYRTIVADPPWEISARIGKGGRRRNETTVPYSFMTMQDLLSVGVHEFAHDDCVLFLWCTRRVFRDGSGAWLAREWGFEPCGEIIWGLRNPGIGSRTIANDHEPVLIAKQGKPRLEATEPLGVYFWRQVYEYGPAGVPQKVHSAKPPGFLELVEQITDEPRLELFAREARLGWDSWGHEALNHVELAT